MSELKRSRARTILFGILSTLVSIAIALTLLELGLRFLPVATILSAVEVNENNPVFRFTPNRHYVWSKGWNFSIVNKGRVNKNGFVNDLDYDAAPDALPLIAVIGDSYVEAQMVPYHDTVQGRLARRVGDRGRVYSFGSSGAPLSQYLTYAEHAAQTFVPEAMIFVIISNDFDESLLKYKAKPGFQYFVEGAGGELTLTRIDYKPSLIGRLIRSSALARYVMLNLNLYHQIKDLLARRSHNEVKAQDYAGNVPWSVEPERVADSIRAIDAFLDQLPTQSGLPASRHLFVLDGIRPHLYSPAKLAATADSYYDLMRRHFIQAAQQRGYELIDMQPLFLRQYQQDGLRFEFPTDGHWNGHAHGVAADAIASSRTYARALGTAD